MSSGDHDRDDARLKAAVTGALQARDRASRTPAFHRLWPAEGARPPGAGWLRPAFASAAVLAVAAALAWTYLGRREGDAARAVDLRATTELAQELSSPDYWRVPSDELLAFAAPPLSAELPVPEGFNISLEESLL
ncbi:MAG TPA: hypothetical protein VH856_09755 [Steroidobacteraceae bacterium]|jgi:hypothetical protein